MSIVKIKPLEELILIYDFDRHLHAFRIPQGNGIINLFYLGQYLSLPKDRKIEINEFGFWEGIKIMPDMVDFIHPVVESRGNNYPSLNNKGYFWKQSDRL